MFCCADFICQICKKFIRNMVKWVTAFIGYYLFRFPGAIFGYFVGSLVEQFTGGTKAFSSTRFSSSEPALFQLNLLALAATVIKADGQVKAQELQFVRNFFITNYGSQKSASIFETFNSEIKKKTQNISSLAQVFVQQTSYETRLQILHFLFGVAQADGSISQLELNKIEQIAAALGIRPSELDSIKAMFIKSTDNAYKILEITVSATDAEVKKAYRNMAKKYHPDKLQSKDPALIKGAQEKFQEVQKAYELIQKERGL
jgi:DnaJ like chaperone protein